MTPAQLFAAIESNDLVTVARALAPTPACRTCRETHDDSPRGWALCAAAVASHEYDHHATGWRSEDSRRLASAYQAAYIAYVLDGARCVGCGATLTDEAACAACGRDQ